MIHFQKIIIYLIALTINFVFIQTDLLSQNDSLVNKDTLTIGGFYKITLISGEVILGEIQGYDSISISVISDENVINIKQEIIKSIEIPKIDYHTESSFGNLQNWDSYWSIGVIGGGISPVGDSFGKKHGFSGSMGSDFVYHIKSYWAIYGNITYNFFSHKEPDYYYYGYSAPDNSGSCLEITIGTRSYLSQKRTRVFIDAGLGLYSYNESFSSESDDSFGLNLGFGTDIILSKKFSFIPKIKYHVIISGNRGVESYAGFYAGIMYNFKK